MRKKTAKALYGSVIESGSGKLVYNLLNPISRQAWSGSGGRMYRAIYVVNPIDGGAISRLQISEEDVSKLDGLSKIIISDATGEVRAVRENGGVAFLGWWLYRIHAKHMVHICNEEGRLQGLPYNLTFFGVSFVGTILFVGVLGDEFADLSKECAEILLRLLERSEQRVL